MASNFDDVFTLNYIIGVLNLIILIIYCFCTGRRCLEVVLSDPEVSKLFHPKHISGPLRFKQAATPVVKWLKEVDTYAIYPHWYKRSSFGIPKDKYYQQAEVFLEVETTNNHNCDLVVSLGEHDGEDINRSEEEVEYHDDDE